MEDNLTPPNGGAAEAVAPPDDDFRHLSFDEFKRRFLEDARSNLGGPDDPPKRPSLFGRAAAALGTPPAPTDDSSRTFPEHPSPSMGSRSLASKVAEGAPRFLEAAFSNEAISRGTDQMLTFFFGGLGYKRKWDDPEYAKQFAATFRALGDDEPIHDPNDPWAQAGVNMGRMIPAAAVTTALPGPAAASWVIRGLAWASKFALINLTAYDPYEPGLAELASMADEEGLSSVVKAAGEALTVDEDDPLWEAYGKRAVENLIAGAPFDALAFGIARRAARKAAAAPTIVDVLEDGSAEVRLDYAAPQVRNAAARRFEDVAEFVDPEASPLVDGTPYAVLTWANPNGQATDEAAQAAAISALKRRLDDMGYSYTEQVGVYGSREPSLLVFGMDDETALMLGREGNQQSVIANGRMIYRDGVSFSAQGVAFDQAADDFYSEAVIGGRKVKYQLQFPDETFAHTPAEVGDFEALAALRGMSPEAARYVTGVERLAASADAFLRNAARTSNKLEGGWIGVGGVDEGTALDQLSYLAATKIVMDRMGPRAFAKFVAETYPEFASDAVAAYAKGTKHADRIVKKLKKLKGTINDADPSKTKFSGKLPTRERLDELLRKGWWARLWYNDEAEIVRGVFGEDLVKPVIGTMSATSPLQPVSGNATQTIKAAAAKLAGENVSEVDFAGRFAASADRAAEGDPKKIGGFMTGKPGTPGQPEKIDALWNDGEFTGGMKTRSFVLNLEDSELVNRMAVTVDRWVARVFFGTDTVTDGEYKFVRALIREEAARHGLDPREYQAAIWFAIKDEWGDTEKAYLSAALIARLGSGYLEMLIRRVGLEVDPKVLARLRRAGQLGAEHGVTMVDQEGAKRVASIIRNEFGSIGGRPQGALRAAWQAPDGQVFTGTSHYAALAENLEAIQAYGKEQDRFLDGFVDSTGRFITRDEAAQHAFEAGLTSYPFLSGLDSGDLATGMPKGAKVAIRFRGQTFTGDDYLDAVLAAENATGVGMLSEDGVLRRGATVGTLLESGQFVPRKSPEAGFSGPSMLGGMAGGAVAGGLIGGQIGDEEDRGRNAVIGAVAGGLGGTFLGAKAGKAADDAAKAAGSIPAAPVAEGAEAAAEAIDPAAALKEQAAGALAPKAPKPRKPRGMRVQDAAAMGEAVGRRMNDVAIPRLKVTPEDVEAVQKTLRAFLRGESEDLEILLRDGTYVNLASMFGPTGDTPHRALIEAVSDVFKKELDEAVKAGGVSVEQAIAAAIARTSDLTMEEAEALAKQAAVKGEDLVIETLVIDMAVKQSDDDLLRQFEVMNARPFDPIVAEEGRRLLERHLNLLESAARVRTAWGRQGRFMQERSALPIQKWFRKPKPTPDPLANEAGAVGAQGTPSGPAPQTQPQINMTPQAAQIIRDATPEQVHAILRMASLGGGWRPQVLRQAVQVGKMSGWDMAHEWYINALLSGPKTMATIAQSGIALGAWESSVKAIAGLATLNKDLAREGIDTLFSMGAYLKDNIAALLSGLRGNHAGVELLRAGKAFKESRSVFDAGTARQPAIAGRLGSMVRTPTRFIGAMDEFQKTLYYRAEVRAKSLRAGRAAGLSGAALEARVQADLWAAFDPTTGAATLPNLQRKAQVVTLSADFGQGSMHSALNRLAEDYKGLRWIVPFIKAPYNGIRYVTDAVPGLRSALSADVKAALEAGGEEAAVINTRFALLASVAGLTALWAMNDNVTGAGPKDPQLYRLWAQTHEPYSIRVGNKWVSYRRGDPWATMMGQIANFVESARQGTSEYADEAAEEFIMRLLAGGMKSAMDATWFRGLAEFSEAVSSGEPGKLSRFFGTIATGMVPRAVSAFDLDPNVRQARTILERLQRSIPGWSEGLPVKYDVWGDPVLKARGVVNDKVNPFVLKDAPEGITLEDVLLAHDIKLGPRQNADGLDVVPRFMYGKRIDLASDVFDNGSGKTPYDRFAELLREKDLRGEIAAVVNDPGWWEEPRGNAEVKRGPREQQVYDAFDRIWTEAFEDLRDEYPKLDAAVEQVRERRSDLRRYGASEVDSLEALFK